jgi:hypothetical protein
MLPLSYKALDYTRGELFRRAGIEPMDGSAPHPHIHYGDPNHVRPGEIDIIVTRCSDDAVDRLLALSPDSLDWVPGSSLLPGEKSEAWSTLVPVLLWGAGRSAERSPFVERRGDGAVVFNADIFAGSFFMLDRKSVV